MNAKATGCGGNGGSPNNNNKNEEYRIEVGKNEIVHEYFYDSEEEAII